MNLSWEEEFNQAIASFGPYKESEPIEYRIHYDDTGHIIMCSMQNHPNNQQYLIVDKQSYDQYFRYRVNVKRKTLEKIVIDHGIRVKLKKSNHGFAVVKNQAGLILDADEEYIDIEYYDTTD